MYYFQKNTDDANTGLPMGYQIGVVDKFNPAPKGSVEIDDQAELDKLIKQAEKDDDIDVVDPESAEVNKGEPKEECPVQIPEGRRWYDSVVTVAVDPSMGKKKQDHLIDCYNVHKEWVERNSSARRVIIDDYEAAQIKITRGHIDGTGKTLAQAELSIRTEGEKILAVTVKFDIPDGVDHFTGLHEFCHGDGVAHQTFDPEGLMYPAKNDAEYYGQYEEDEYGTKYPKQKLS